MKRSAAEPRTSELYYTIGAVSRLLGVHRHTIARWENAGLIPPPRRLRGAWRTWSEQELAELRVAVTPLLRPPTPRGAGRRERVRVPAPRQNGTP